LVKKTEGMLGVKSPKCNVNVAIEGICNMQRFL
jgi:hypothetical protein